ncbi:MAG: hypothetical protein ACREUX_14675 [Burkholderiales bacterium]
MPQLYVFKKLMIKISTSLGAISDARRIGLAVGCGSAVGECLQRATAAGLTDWALVEALDEQSLEHRLYPAKAGSRGSGPRPMPDQARALNDQSPVELREPLSCEAFLARFNASAWFTPEPNPAPIGIGPQPRFGIAAGQQSLRQGRTHMARRSARRGQRNVTSK